MFIRILLVVISSILFIFSFPLLEIEWLIWFAIVPWLIAMEGRSKLEGFLLSFLWAILVSSGLAYWVAMVDLLSLVIAVLIVVAPFFGLFGFTCVLSKPFLGRYLGIKRVVFLSLLWLIIEYLRTNFMSLGFHWGTLGFVLYRKLPFIQIAKIGGVYAVSFLIFLINIVIADFIMVLFKRENILKNTAKVMACILLVFGWYWLGKRSIDKEASLPREKIKIGIIQANIGIPEKWDASKRDLIVERHIRLSKLAAREGPLMIVWPETSVPAFLLHHPDLLNSISNAAKELGTYLLVGCPRKREEKGRTRYYNSTLLISPEGDIQEEYDKIRLVPFAEYNPMGDRFDIFNVANSPIGNIEYLPGREDTIYNISSRRFGTVICFEITFASFIRQFVLKGADFIVNPTNESWFGKSSAAYQHVAMSVFRAVENRISIIRVANTGISCFIDSSGEIKGSVNDDQGNQLFISGYLVKDIELFEKRKRTFYTKYGDLLVYLAILVWIFQIGLIIKKSIGLPANPPT